MKFREPVPIRTGPYSPKKMKKKKASNSSQTPETLTKMRFLTHPCSTVAYAMRVLFSVLCALKPKEVYSNLRFSIFGATPPSGQGT